MDNLQKSHLFTQALMRHVERKAKLYDGINTHKPPEWFIAICAEELGEVASEILRRRPYAAISECIDLAHTAMLIAINLDKTGDIIDSLNRDDDEPTR